MVSGYRMWNGEEAFFVVESLRPFAVHDVYYDAIALAYTPGTINGVLSFYAYGGQANICVVDRMGHVVYTGEKAGFCGYGRKVRRMRDAQNDGRGIGLSGLSAH